MFEKLNKNSVTTIKEGIELKELPFVKLKDCIGETLKVDGFFFTNGSYGKQVVVVANGKKINFPNRAIAQFEDIMANEEMLKAVLEGKLIINDIKEVKAKKGTTTSYKLVG